MNLDRVKKPLADFVRLVMAPIDYYGLYEATVLSQSGNTVDVKPKLTSKIPGLQGIPIRVGNPGDAITVTNGANVLIGWRNGDPSLPYVANWSPGNLASSVTTASQKLSFVAPAVNLGQDPGTDAVILGSTFIQALNAFLTGLSAFIATTSSATTAAQIATAAGTFSPFVSAFKTAADNSLSTITKTS